MTALTTAKQTQAHSIMAMIDANPRLANTTKAKYKAAMTRAIEAGVSLTDAGQLADYATGLSKSGAAFLKAGLTLWADATALRAKAQNDGSVETNAKVRATIDQLDVIKAAVQVPTSKGQKAHTWLTQAEVKRLLSSCNTRTTIGKRDRVVLGLLVAAGLRREELANLKFDDVVLQPVGGKIRTVLNVTGKGAKNRIVPINDKLAAALDEWRTIAGGGHIARSITKGGAIGETISAVGIFHITRAAGDDIGKGDLAPHDLRRTFAQLGYEAGVPITQISTLLGHSSVATTQRYLNLDLDLETTISDFIPFA